MTTSTLISAEDWPTEPERRYARYQTRLADQYGLDIESCVLDTDAVDRIHYLTAGNPDGEPVVLLHGATGQAAYWLPLMPALTDRYRVYAPDMPGEGLSAKLSYRGRDHRSFLVAYLVELFDTLGLDRPHVVGNSFGGGQAFLLAIDHDRVDRLGLVGAPIGLSRDFPIMNRLLSIRGLNRVLFWLMNMGDPIENAHQWVGLFVEDDSSIPDAFYDLYAVRSEIPGLKASLRSLMTELATFGRVRPLMDIRDEVADIERPTSFVWGSDDYYWRPMVGRSVANRMSDATFHELPDHGHIPWMEPGDEVETRVQSFLGG